MSAGRSALSKISSQLGCEGGQLVGDEHRLLGVDPPDDVVVRGEAMGVLECELGLAHSAEPVQGLDDQGRLPGPQLAPQFGEQVVAAGEVRVAGRRVPGPPRQSARRNGGILA
jgi:hypothetical protein